jgi:hypothetical protein
MNKEFWEKIKALPRLKLLIIIFTVWQYFSIAGIAILNWSPALIWLNMGLLLAFILLAPIYESILLLVLSIPFFVVVPIRMYVAQPFIVDGASMEPTFSTS